MRLKQAAHTGTGLVMALVCVLALVWVLALVLVWVPSLCPVGAPPNPQGRVKGEIESS